MGIGTACIYNGKRMTASSAYLNDQLANLTVKTDSLVARVLFHDKLAAGVETENGMGYKARQEVIICGGAINTPQILMLSGIGSMSGLSDHGLEMVHELPQVGKNLQDHCFSTAGLILRKRHHSPHKKQSPSPMGWFKLKEVESSSEFENLTDAMKAHLSRDTIPH